MAASHQADASLSLFTPDGQRKYLTREERLRFLKALTAVDEISRTFCEMIFRTGCRPSEALALTRENINVESGHVIIRSLKKRGKRKDNHYRVVPLPRCFLKRLIDTHSLAEMGGTARLWRFSRTTGWKRMSAVMQQAGVTGRQACARGLRHSFGVNASLKHVPETRIKNWLGHENLETTATYLDMAELEDRTMAQRMWEGEIAPLEPLDPPPRQQPPQTSNAISSEEIIRLVSAYSAIPERKPRLSLLDHLEDQARREGQYEIAA